MKSALFALVCSSLALFASAKSNSGSLPLVIKCFLSYIPTLTLTDAVLAAGRRSPALCVRFLLAHQSPPTAWAESAEREEHRQVAHLHQKSERRSPSRSCVRLVALYSSASEGKTNGPRSTAGIYDYTLTGAPNRIRLVNKPTVIFAIKVPQLTSAQLNGISVDSIKLEADSVVVIIMKSAVGKTKYQINDASTGGIFQVRHCLAHLSRPSIDV